jgi:hypothetical protein
MQLFFRSDWLGFSLRAALLHLLVKDSATQKPLEHDRGLRLDPAQLADRTSFLLF